MAQQLVLMDSEQLTAIIFGTCDENVKRIEQRFDVRISNRHPDNSAGDALQIDGEDKENVERAARVLKYLKRMVDAGGTIGDQSVDYVISMVADGAEEELNAMEDDVICITTRQRESRCTYRRKYRLGRRDSLGRDTGLGQRNNRGAPQLR